MMTRLGHHLRTYLFGHHWLAMMGVLSLLLSVLVWVVEPEGSSAQTADLFTVDVSKTTDLVSGETIELNLRTVEGTIVDPGIASVAYTCQVVDQPDYQYTQADFTDGTCVLHGARLSEADNSVDVDFLHRFPDEGPEHGRRAITILRPGVGTANWQSAGGARSVTCGPDDPCRLVYDVHTSTDGVQQAEIRSGPVLGYRPSEGVVGCDAQSPDVVASTMPDRLQDAWLSWTRDACQAADGEPPTSAFFEPEGNALNSFAAGDFDLTYSAVGYRPGFDPPEERPMVPVPIGLNAVVVAVGGGYPVVDGSWPFDFPKPHSEFRLTNQQLAILFGQWEQALLFSDAVNEVLTNNPQIPGLNFLLNSNAGQSLALTGPQSTTLFASTHLDTLAPDEWKSSAGVARGVETDFNKSEPPHVVGEVDLKTGRPDLARIVYKELYSQGTYYVLTDLTTANALGLTVVSLPDAANPGGWVTPSAETLAAAAPHMLEQDDGTLVPNPNTPAGYPLTFVEYAMAPAQSLVDDACVPRTGSQELLDDWLTYVTTEGQGQLSPELGGLVPLTGDLETEAATALEKVGATPAPCTPAPTTPAANPPTASPSPGGTTPNNLGSGSGSGSGSGTGSGSGSGSGNGSGTGGAGTGPAAAPRAATPETQKEAAEAATEAEIELPDLLGVRSINDLMPPVALLSIVVLSTVVALATAGYPAPAALGRGARRLRRQAGGVVDRLLRRKPLPTERPRDAPGRPGSR